MGDIDSTDTGSDPVYLFSEIMKEGEGVKIGGMEKGETIINIHHFRKEIYFLITKIRKYSIGMPTEQSNGGGFSVEIPSSQIHRSLFINKNNQQSPKRHAIHS